jgi:CheY-like chemotaxis protein
VTAYVDIRMPPDGADVEATHGQQPMDDAEAQRSDEQTRGSSAAAGDRWPDLTGAHVLLIEDNDDTRIMVGETLQHCGAFVTTYRSADEALAHLTEFVPSVLICDLSMPGVDGLEFMLRLRARRPEHGGRIPSVAITAYYEDFAAAAALEVGFDAYMTKPIKLEQLCRLVQELVAARA